LCTATHKDCSEIMGMENNVLTAGLVPIKSKSLQVEVLLLPVVVAAVVVEEGGACDEDPEEEGAHSMVVVAKGPWLETTDREDSLVSSSSSPMVTFVCVLCVRSNVPTMNIEFGDGMMARMAWTEGGGHEPQG
jgi:hypothetical protein